MNKELLRTHIKTYLAKLAANDANTQKDVQERDERTAYYRSWTAQRLEGMTEAELAQYVSKLWAMRMWGNKQYVVDKLIAKHGLQAIRSALANLVWGKEPVEARWDKFRNDMSGLGPAMMSEILCYTHPEKHILWNRRAKLA